MTTIVNDDEKKLLDAAYIKLRNGEQPSIIDLQRFINFILQAPMIVSQPNDDEIFGAYNRLVAGMQDKFKQPSQ